MTATVHRRKPNFALNRIARIMERQSELRWGPDYLAATQLEPGESKQGGTGELFMPRAQRWLYASSWPEKVACAFAIYAGCFEIHDQFVYYPRPMFHPLGYHPRHATLRTWPATEGTLAIASDLNLTKWHPKAWCESDGKGVGDANEGQWVIGAYVGDFALYLLDSQGVPYVLYMEVKPDESDHGKPGGSPLRLLSKQDLARAEARARIVAHYAEQLDSRIVEFSVNDFDRDLAPVLVSLCREQSNTEFSLSDTAVAELVQAYRESVEREEGKTPRDIAKGLVRSDDLMAAKQVLSTAVWERHVRVDLYKGLLWNRPLLPERRDVLVEYARLLRP